MEVGLGVKRLKGFFNVRMDQSAKLLTAVLNRNSPYVRLCVYDYVLISDDFVPTDIVHSLYRVQTEPRQVLLDNSRLSWDNAIFDMKSEINAFSSGFETLGKKTLPTPWGCGICPSSKRISSASVSQETPQSLRCDTNQDNSVFLCHCFVNTLMRQLT